MAPSVTSASTHYALVVDAGSSGSRLQIYSWRDPDLERAEILQEVKAARSDGGASGGRGAGGREAEEGKGRWWWREWVGKGKGKGKASERDMERVALRRLVRVGKGVEGDAWVKRVEPGISTVSPADIPSYLSPLLSHALQQIPPSQHAHTPIYVLATAGMRLLPDASRHAILDATCSLLRRDYPFLVGQASAAGPCGENVRVISGEEEGMWGWVAVNYLMDGFGHAPPPHTPVLSDPSSSTSSAHSLLPLAPLADPPPDSSSDSVTPVDVHHHSPTFGFLDMGGASTQLAFSPTPSELLQSGYPESDLEHISLRLLSGETVEWPVFVASWLGFGTNRVRERYTDTLIEQWRRGGTKSLSEAISDPCLPLNLRLPAADSAAHPDFMGTGSFSECLSALTPLLEHSHPCPANHCLFGGVPTPHIDFEREDQRGFIGISEYWYTAQQVLGLGGVWDWGEWERGMKDFCGREWRGIEEQLREGSGAKGFGGMDVELSRMHMQCFKGAWISNVLHEGIGIPRLMDPHGNDTLTGGSPGDTNAEAERRAREKGLLEPNPAAKPAKPHFQSMDEIGETAISWTLGKMVIEASRAVPPRSYSAEQVWTSRLGAGVGQLEARLGELGIEAIWAYGFIAFGLMACMCASLSRRYGWKTRHGGGGGGGYRRGRKPSVSNGAPPISPTSAGGGPAQWLAWLPSFIGVGSSGVSSRDIENGYYSSTSEDIDLTPVKSSSRATIGRLRLWSLRTSSFLRRHSPFPLPLSHNHKSLSSSNARQLSMSMPLTATTTNAALSQPSSPRPSSSAFFFTPAANGLAVPSSSSASSRPTSTSPDTAPAPSPPRLKGSGRPLRGGMGIGSRRNSHNTLGPPGMLDGSSGGGGGGWNDPPGLMLGGVGGGGDLVGGAAGGGGGGSGVLTPTAGLGNGYDHVLSRNSSRVNLSDLGGLAQRSASRAATPFDDASP